MTLIIALPLVPVILLQTIPDAVAPPALMGKPAKTLTRSVLLVKETTFSLILSRAIKRVRSHILNQQ